MNTDRTSPPPSDLAGQLARVTAELAALREEVGHLARREIAVEAIYRAAQEQSGSLHFARQALQRGIAIGRQQAGATAPRPVSRRDRHGLRVVAAGES